jgi:hypothetical protein
MQRRIWLVLALTLLILIGLDILPASIRNIDWFLHGRTARDNYPGTVIATPAWFLLLPFSILTIWKRKLGGRLSAAAGAGGVIGSLTMPCAWQPINRPGFIWGLVLSAIAVLLGFWLSRKPRIASDSGEIIR